MKFAAILALACSLGAETFENLSARATSAREGNDVPHAIELYKQALDVNPNWVEGWWYLGSLSYDADQYPAARDALTHFVAISSQAGPAWGLLGLSEFETGDYAAALKHIQQALSPGAPSEPQMDAVLRYHEALLLTRAGEFDAAMQKYIWFVQKAQPNPDLLVGIGLAALRQRMVPSEIPAGQRDLFTAGGQAAFFTMARDFNQASQKLQELLNRFPESPGVHYLYGCYLLAGAPDHAIGELKHELKIAPSNDAASAMLAWALLNRGEPDAALPYARKAAAGTPSLPTAQYVLGRSLVETGDLKAGTEHLESALKLDPDNLENHLALVTAYSKAGRTQDARREREKSVELAMRGAVAAQ